MFKLCLPVRSLIALPALLAPALLVSSLALVAPAIHAEEAEEGEESAEKVIAPSSQYHTLDPSFVTNFGDPAIKKLKFVKADIALRVFGNEALQHVKDHNALIRHQIVMLLSKQTEESMAVADGQEKLRLQMLEQVNKVLQEETGAPQIDDLLFTTFVIQR